MTARTEKKNLLTLVASLIKYNRHCSAVSLSQFKHRTCPKLCFEPDANNSEYRAERREKIMESKRIDTVHQGQWCQVAPDAESRKKSRPVCLDWAHRGSFLKITL